MTVSKARSAGSRSVSQCSSGSPPIPRNESRVKSRICAEQRVPDQYREESMDPNIVGVMTQLAPMIVIVTIAGVGGWVLTTWLRIKNGYPLDGAWGQAVYPKNNDETTERVKLLSQENAQLRAELGSIKDRLVNVERIVTDEGHRLTQEIESLRIPKN